MVLFSISIVETQPPENDQLEITLYGPGMGESIIVHLGANDWLIVDSCRVGDARQPAPLAYLKNIGVDPQRVRAVVATHWHDDHIKGLGEVVQSCDSAFFVCSQALVGNEFRTLLQLQNQDTTFSSDTSEFDSILKHFARTGRLSDRDNFPLRYGSANRRLWYRPANANVVQCEVYSLSPSDMAVTNWLRSLSNLTSTSSVRTRISAPRPNQISVGLWINVGTVRVLLSADLEESGNTAGGWRVIVGSAERPSGKASANKVSHHGSQNGHHDGVWSDMLEPNPVAILTPYNRGTERLPSKEDIERINGLTNRAYITSKLKDRSFRGKTGTVDRTIREVARKIRTLDAEPGFVRIRRSIVDPGDDWKIETFGGACPLQEAY